MTDEDFDPCEVCGEPQWPGLPDDVPLCASCLRGAVWMALKVADDAAASVPLVSVGEQEK